MLQLFEVTIAILRKKVVVKFWLIGKTLQKWIFGNKNFNFQWILLKNISNWSPSQLQLIWVPLTVYIDKLYVKTKKNAKKLSVRVVTLRDINFQKNDENKKIKVVLI